MKKTIFLFLFILLFIPFKVLAASEIMVMDLDSGRVLYENNADEKRLIASITKIMTAIIVIENVKDLEKQVTVGEEVLKSYGTNIYIGVGEKIKVKDLLYGLLLRSGNDAAMTLAITTTGSSEEFVSLMNKKAEEIGMTNTIFQNPHGLDEETKNYSTARDMAILSRYANKNKIYRMISKTKKYSVQTSEKSYLWYNRNKLLSTYKYCTGGKNGYTPSAGKTLVTTASKEDLNLTVVTLNDPNIYESHESLYEYYFSKYKKYKIIDKDNFSFDKTLFDKELYIKDSFEYPLKEEEVSKVRTKIVIENKERKHVGNIYIYLEDKEIGSIPVYTSGNTKEKEEVSLFAKIKNWIFDRS